MNLNDTILHKLFANVNKKFGATYIHINKDTPMKDLTKDEMTSIFKEYIIEEINNTPAFVEELAEILTADVVSVRYETYNKMKNIHNKIIAGEALTPEDLMGILSMLMPKKSSTDISRFGRG